MPEGRHFFSSKVRNKFLFHLPSLLKHCGISRGLCVPCELAHQLSPVHQLSCSHRYQAGMAQTLLQWVAAPASQENPQHPSCPQPMLMNMEIPVAPPPLAAWSCPSRPSRLCVPVKLLWILRAWHLASSERQGCTLLLHPACWKTRSTWLFWNRWLPSMLWHFPG